MVWKMVICFKKKWEINLTSRIFKRNSPLAKVVEDIGEFGVGLTKQYYIIIVKRDRKQPREKLLFD